MFVLIGNTFLAGPKRMKPIQIGQLQLRKNLSCLTLGRSALALALTKVHTNKSGKCQKFAMTCRRAWALAAKLMQFCVNYSLETK